MFRRRTIILAACFGLGFVALLLRLVDLQVVRSGKYRSQRLNRTHRLVQVPPRRGRIRDRQGRVLAEDVPSFDLWLVPARVERRGGHYAVATQIPGFTAARMVRVARSQGGERELDCQLARRDLEENHPLVDALVPLLRQGEEDAAACRRRLASELLEAILSRNAYSEEALTRPRPCFDNVDRRAYLAVERAQRDPATADLFDAFEPRIGTHRIYPHGPIMGHLTGYVGKLSAKEYRVLRGVWQDGERVPGTGIIRHRENVFFSVLPNTPYAPGADLAPEESVEMSIIRLVERRRAGRTERYAGYFRNEMVGRSGVEQYYNQRLRGRHAQRYLRLERPGARGPRRLTVVGTRGEVRNGEDIGLTIDLELQRQVRRTLLIALDGPRSAKERLEYSHMLGRNGLQTIQGLSLDRCNKRHALRGVCVLMNPNNGEIYAMVSVPGYDPNRIRDSAYLKALLADERHPFINHAIAGRYPPGSTIKPIVALGALQDERITTATEFFCEGGIEAGHHRFRCMGHHGHSDVVRALQVSCNVFFYDTGKALGPKRLYQWAWDFGYGHRTEVDVAGENPGYLDYTAKTGKGWALGNTYHLAIGQVKLEVTPLQVAVAYAVIANGGRVVQPHVVVGETERERPRAELNLDPTHLATVRSGMRKAVMEEGGTAYRCGRIPGLPYCGKTGSAEWRKGERTHAWFACYAPAKDPEVVCVVLVPEGGHGGSTCAPIARRVLMDFFDIREPGNEEEAGG